MKSTQICICQHLYQIYPNIPKYANDPQQSQIIRVYDLILRRFQGLYGRQPKYFIRSPASCPILGSTSKSNNFPIASICSIQNIIICLTLNGYDKIRINHYQNAVYGEKIFENQINKWKYQQKNDQYTNTLIATLKTYGVMFNAHQLPGIDVLIYDDFVQDQHMAWKQALCLGFAIGLYSVTHKQKSVLSIKQQFFTKFLTKVSTLLHQVKITNFISLGQYGNLSITQSQHSQHNKHLQFPKQYSIIFAHSMTPQPKKMTLGKRQNLRICQIQIGIQIIKNQLGAVNNIINLYQLQKYVNCSIKELKDMLDQYIPKGQLTIQKIQQLTQKSLIQILKPIPYANSVIDQNFTFKPYNRILYYLQQQLALQSLTTQNLIPTIKQLHDKSLQLLEIGSQQIQQMIGIIKDMGQCWKIVGDGWGGYLMIICENKKSQAIVQELINKFYKSQKNKVLLSDDIDQYIRIVGQPSNGLRVLDPQSQIWFC